MPLKLTPPTTDHPYWRIIGDDHLNKPVNMSTGTADERFAERLLVAVRHEIEKATIVSRVPRKE